MQEYILNLDDILLIESFKNMKFEDTFEEDIHNFIETLSISKLYEIGIIDNDDFLLIKENCDNLSEGFFLFASKVKDKLENVEAKIRTQVEKVIVNLKVFEGKIIEIFIDFLNYAWEKTKGNVNQYVDNLYLAVKGTKEVKSKGFKDEAIWYEKTYVWFEKDLPHFLGSLIGNSVKGALKESIQDDYSILGYFLNESDMFELTAAEDKHIFAKVHDDMKDTIEYKAFKKVADLLVDISQKIEGSVASKVENNLFSFAYKFQNWPGAPKAPDDFSATGFLAEKTANLGLKMFTGLSVDLLNWKEVRMMFLKQFLHAILVGVVPGIDLIFVALYLKKYFIILGMTISKLAKDV